MGRAATPRTQTGCGVYLAEHDGDLVAATTFVRVGEHAWYSYGASTNAKREVRGSNAVQWRMIRDANAAGCAVYDLRGIVEGVGADDPEIGLIQFKVGTGGEAVAYLGEWDLPDQQAALPGLRPLPEEALTMTLDPHDRPPALASAPPRAPRRTHPAWSPSRRATATASGCASWRRVDASGREDASRWASRRRSRPCAWAGSTATSSSSTHGGRSTTRPPHSSRPDGDHDGVARRGPPRACHGPSGRAGHRRDRDLDAPARTGSPHPDGPDFGALTFEGWAIHLPAHGSLDEAKRLAAAGLAVRRAPVWVSHLTVTDYRVLRTALGVRTHLRVGTRLWLGDKRAYRHHRHCA